MRHDPFDDPFFKTRQPTFADNDENFFKDSMKEMTKAIPLWMRLLWVAGVVLSLAFVGALIALIFVAIKAIA